MEAKKTKGRQRREIKKIENEKDLFVTFTKRKSGIYKKASELTTLCGAKVDILMFSPTGKSFCYGDPSIQSMKRSRSNEQDPPEGGIFHQLVEKNKSLEIDELNGKNDALMDQMYAEKEREKELEGILKTRNSCGWWEAKMEELSYEQAKEMEASLVDLQKKLTSELSNKCGENASHAPVDQTNGLNPYPTYASWSNLSEVALDANNEAYGTGANESFLPDLSFSPINEEQIAPIDQNNGVNYASGSDISEVGFGANNEAYGIGASKSVLSDFSFSPTNVEQTAPIDQTNGVNPYPTYASASNIFEVAFGANNDASGIGASESFLPHFDFSPTIEEQTAPMDQTKGLNPYPTYASGSNKSEITFGANNEVYGIGASESFLPDFFFSPTNEEQTFNLTPYDEHGGDLFDVVFPPKTQANGSGSVESAFAFLPTNQVQGVNLTDASGSGNHALAISPPNQHKGNDPFLYNASNENATGSGSHALAVTPSNQYQGDNPFLYNASYENAGESGTYSLTFLPSNQHQEVNPFLYNASDEKDDFSFPPFNGYGHGYF